MMAETIARIGESGTIELVDEKMTRLADSNPMTPADAAFLARGLLSCAALLALDKSAKIGAICADLHFPILKWVITTQSETKMPVVIFSIPPGIDVTFQIPAQMEKEFGSALVAHAEGDQPPAPPPGVVH